jgi:hypothetical protein
MRVDKRILGQLDRVYATAVMEINGELNYLTASEGLGPCWAYSAKDWARSTVWEGPGGTQNIVPIPGRRNEFIASQGFLPNFQAQEARLVYARLDAGTGWSVRPIMTIPYVHRFDVFILHGKLHFIGATVSAGKKDREDWSQPGAVYTGEISDAIGEPFELSEVLTGITKNHGFCRGKWQGREAYFISGSEGVFVLYLPIKKGDAWAVEQILDHEVSDIAVCDIDGDGCEELAAIEPFHGSRGVIYKRIDGKLRPVHEHEYEFGHVVWGGRILNKPSFIIGGRKGNRELNCFQMDQGTGRISHFTIDNTGGPSNIAVFHKQSSDMILAANREIGEIAIYEISE